NPNAAPFSIPLDSPAKHKINYQHAPAIAELALYIDTQKNNGYDASDDSHRSSTRSLNSSDDRGCSACSASEPPRISLANRARRCETCSAKPANSTEDCRKFLCRFAVGRRRIRAKSSACTGCCRASGGCGSGDSEDCGESPHYV